MACEHFHQVARGDLLAEDDSSKEDDDTESDDKSESYQQPSGAIPSALVHLGVLCHYEYPAEKAYVDSNFVLDMFLTCDLSIYLYIFLTHMDALLWFYYVSLFMMMWNANAYVMYYYTRVCIF